MDLLFSTWVDAHANLDLRELCVQASICSHQISIPGLAFSHWPVLCIQSTKFHCNLLMPILRTNTDLILILKCLEFVELHTSSRILGDQSLVLSLNSTWCRSLQPSEISQITGRYKELGLQISEAESSFCHLQVHIVHNRAKMWDISARTEPTLMQDGVT